MNLNPGEMGVAVVFLFLIGVGAFFYFTAHR